jgi:hypothetical protein
LHGLIRVKHCFADWIMGQSDGQTKAQLSLFRFRYFSSLETLM